jgi:hypothetical protein
VKRPCSPTARSIFPLRQDGEAALRHLEDCGRDQVRAFNCDGDLIGIFKSRSEASRAIALDKPERAAMTTPAFKLRHDERHGHAER